MLVMSARVESVSRQVLQPGQLGHDLPFRGYIDELVTKSPRY